MSAVTPNQTTADTAIQPKLNGSWPGTNASVHAEVMALKELASLLKADDKFRLRQGVLDGEGRKLHLVMLISWPWMCRGWHQSSLITNLCF